VLLPAAHTVWLLRSSFLARQFVFGRGRFQFFQLQFHLLQEPRFAFRTAAVEFAPQLLDFQTEMGDQRLGAGGYRLSTRRSRLGARRSRLCESRRLLRFNTLGTLDEEQCMRAGKIGRKRGQA
jgi:hypothetical protein